MELEQLNKQQFDRFSDFIYRASGIRITEKKRSLLANRIRRRLRAGEFDGFDAYFDHLTSRGDDGELALFLDAITTNETFFFRTPGHFEWFGGEFIKEVADAAVRGRRDRSLRIWSAGCATGAEPYTIAICLLEHMHRLRGWDLEIVGTDISDAALAEARSGRFRPRALEGLGEKRLKRYFEPVDDEDRRRVSSELRGMITFESHNLMTPMRRRPFDCIFIRNVLIYFDEESKAVVVANLIRALAPGGALVIGPAEGLYNMLDPLERRSTFVYRKPLEEAT